MGKERLFWAGLFLLIFSCLAFAADPEDKVDLELTISCDLEEIKQGDEIPIVFTITNKGQNPYSYDDRSYDRSGRIEEFSLVAQDESGNKVRDPREDYIYGIGGGLMGGGEIKHGESFQKTVILNRWALIKKPGRYRVRGMYHFYKREDPDKQVYDFTDPAVRFRSKPIYIDIKKRSYKEMGEYISGLQQSLKSDDKEIRKKDVIKKLMYTCDHRMVPILVDYIYEDKSAFWVNEALSFYAPRTDESKQILLNVLERKGSCRNVYTRTLESLGFNVDDFKTLITRALSSTDLKQQIAGVYYAQDYPDDTHMDRLISFALDSEDSIRYSAIEALAKNRTDEGVKVLRRFLEDDNPDVRLTAERVIKNAYRNQPVRPKVDDPVFTEALLSIANDPHNRARYPAIWLLLKSRTEEAVEAIKEIRKNPSIELPIEKEDKAVAYFRKMLNDPDPEVRKSFEMDIDIHYKDRRGRPFRKDDFPDEFRFNSSYTRQKYLNSYKSD